MKNSLTSLQIKTNKVAAMNELAECANTIAPQLIKIFSGDIQYKNDGTPFKKHLTEINAIIRNLPGKNHAYIEYNTYSTWIRLKTNYKNSEYSCAYIEEAIHLFDSQANKAGDFTPREGITIEEYLQGELELNAHKAEYDAIYHKMQELKRKLEM